MRLRRILPFGLARADMAVAADADVVIEDDCVRFSSRAARRVFGEAAQPGTPAEALGPALGHELAPRAISELLDTGRAFRLRLRSSDDRIYDFEGGPRGARCVLRLRDVTDDARALEAAHAELAARETEIRALRKALELTGAPVWERGADGSVDWRSPAAAAADEKRAPAPEELRRISLENGGELAIAPAPSPTAMTQTVMRDFIETVTETFAHLRVGLAIFDAERRLSLSNPALAEMFGADARWLAARPSLRDVLDRLREQRQLPEQADYPAWRARLFTLFDQTDQSAYEDVWELPDGRALTVIGRAHPLGGIAFVFEDATEAMALQRWRTTAVAVRRATLDALSDAIAVFGADGQLRMSNPAFREMWGLSPEDDAVGGHISELAERCAALGPEPNMWERIKSAVAGGAGRAVWRAHARLADGRVIGARVAPMPDGSTLTAFFDVTAEEQVAQALRDRAAALEAAEELRRTVLEQVAHRLKTPLNAVMGFAGMLSGERAGPMSDQQKGYLADILSAAAQMESEMQELTAFGAAREPDGSQSGVIDVGQALRASFELLAHRLAEREVTLSLAALPERAIMTGDVARIRREIYEFSAAAVTASPRRGELSIGGALSGDDAELWSQVDDAPRQMTVVKA